MVYYFYAYGQSKQSDKSAGLSFSVPTGNFGNIFSAYLAKRMGLPIDRLILATNANDILARFVATGIYQPHDFKTTYSPAMDIQVASNFERYLFYLYGEDTQRLTNLMDDFSKTGKLVVDTEVLRQVQQDFIAYSVDDATCLQTIQHVQKKHDYLLDPHTACAVAAYEKARQNDQLGTPTLCLATAHPVKFPDAMQKVGAQAKEPEAIAHLHKLTYHVEPMAQDLAMLQDKLQSFFA
jgi:threonine synthase